MKIKMIITLFMLSIGLFVAEAQEGTKIPFNSGVLKICSSKNFVIKGYDGDEVIIKNINTNQSYFKVRRTPTGQVTTYGARAQVRSTEPRTQVRSTEPRTQVLYGGTTFSSDTMKVRRYPLIFEDKERSKGLKKLGKEAEAKESGIYLKIEQKDKELIISDDVENSLVMFNNEKYEISIPNSLTLNWNTNGCSSHRQAQYFNSNASILSNFKGEVEITFTLNNIKLKDVTGPVTISTIGGNVTVEFDKTTPKKLYSVYTNNGFIDISFPENSSVSVDAKGEEILSDLNFNIRSEDERNGTKQMNLKLGSGKTKMKLDAGYGNIYLRKN